MLTAASGKARLSEEDAMLNPPSIEFSRVKVQLVSRPRGLSAQLVGRLVPGVTLSHQDRPGRIGGRVLDLSWSRLM